MPFDTICFGATGALAGYTALAAKAQTPYVNTPAVTGSITLPGPGAGGKWCVGLGMTSVTKPQGCRISASESRGGNKFYGPGGISWWDDGVLTDFGLQFNDGEKILFEAANTGVAEYAIGAMWMTDNPHEWPSSLKDAVQAAGGGKLHSVLGNLAPGAQITNEGGIAGLDAVAQETSGWLVRKADKKYHLLGVIHSLPAAVSGLLQVRGLADEWKGRLPAVVVNRLSTTQFDAEIDFVPFYEPIPFNGAGLPQIGFFADANVTWQGGLVILEH